VLLLITIQLKIHMLNLPPVPPNRDRQGIDSQWVSPLRIVLQQAAPSEQSQGRPLGPCATGARRQQALCWTPGLPGVPPASACLFATVCLLVCSCVSVWRLRSWALPFPGLDWCLVLVRRSDEGSFWEEEAAWQAEQLKAEFDVDVVDSRQVSGSLFSKSYTTYKVASTWCEGVWRRYSDFEFMRDILVSRFHGVAVPLLPEKRVVGNMDDEFVSDRRSGLSDWTKKIAAHPYLRLDATFKLFLTLTADTEFEQAKKAASSGTGANPAQNAGLKRWFGCLQRYPMPTEAESAIEELTLLNTTVEDQLIGSLRAVDGYFRATQAMMEALGKVAGSLDKFAKQSTASADKLGPVLASTREQTVALGDLAAKSAHAWSETNSLSKFAENEIELFLKGALGAEISRCRALKALLHVRKAALEAYAKAAQHLNQMRFRQKQFKDKGDTVRAEQIEPQVVEATVNERQMKDRLDDVTKGVLLVESRAVASKRVEMLSALFGCFAATQIASGNTTQSIWMSFLAEAGLDKDVTIGKAQKVIDDRNNVDEIIAVLPSAPDSGFSIASGAKISSRTAAPAASTSAGAAAMDDDDVPAAEAEPASAAAGASASTPAEEEEGEIF
jgi:hypothetical protein